MQHLLFGPQLVEKYLQFSVQQHLTTSGDVDYTNVCYVSPVTEFEGWDEVCTSGLTAALYMKTS
jgi:hypothetical protein